MARGKRVPHVEGEYEAAVDPPAPQELRIASDIYEVYARDPDPKAFWEIMKRTLPRDFARVLLEAAAPILARAHKAGTQGPDAHRRLPTAVSPIRPGIIDVDTRK
jgi:hypothetical protein